MTDLDYVYFISDGQAIKIGISGAPVLRLHDLQKSSPRPLELLHKMPGTLDDEKRLHLKFGHLRLRGEWFSDDGEIRAFIAPQPIAEPVKVKPLTESELRSVKRQTKKLPTFMERHKDALPYDLVCLGYWLAGAAYEVTANPKVHCWRAISFLRKWTPIFNSMVEARVA